MQIGSLPHWWLPITFVPRTIIIIIIVIDPLSRIEKSSMKNSGVPLVFITTPKMNNNARPAHDDKQLFRLLSLMLISKVNSNIVHNER